MNFLNRPGYGSLAGFPFGQTQEVRQPAATETPAQKLAASEKSETTARGKLNDAEYKIGPQDVLRIDVWKEAEVSRAVPVRPDG